MTILAEMRNIKKSFGDVIANRDVSFELRAGEIHALLGENGAGKSTLMNMLSGIYQPDSGSILIHEKPVTIRSPKEAIKLGIGMIHQHYKLVEKFTALENILMGQESSFFLRKKELIQKVEKLARNYHIAADLNKSIYTMSIGEKQSVDILKVLYQGAKILIMDEPTAVLTPQEIQSLFQVMRNMAAEGCGIVIITHKLNEVMEISDRVTVLQKGSTVKTLITAETNQKELTDLMVGKATDLQIERPKTQLGKVVLKVEHLEAINKDKAKVLKDISFELREGEVLGVAGVAGSGQKELCEALAGLYPVSGGQITFHGESLIGKSPAEIINAGMTMSFVPEDRLGMGLVGSMDMIDNYLLKAHHKQKGLFLKRKPLEKVCENMIKALDIQTPDVHYPISKLSGGNIQKVLIGREIETEPQVLITAYAVRGLDVGSAHTIYELINEQKQKGVAILFIGEDLDVIMELCDRIMVLYDGEVKGIVNGETAVKEEIGLLMGGGKLYA
ncbi:ABC transporter ATP-binding protein [Clostridiales bacterium COT073_COT-073]|nr:ABC transporter ATP-binding protein [Clostridiales bacterium COT073_COT-073]